MNTEQPHNQDQGGENRMARFEGLLRQDIGEAGFDWKRLENTLFARIQSADRLGDLALLQADEKADSGLFERIETTLMARIADYKEYQQPIDTVIHSPAPALEGQWQRMENRLEDRIGSLQGLEPWEFILKGSEHPAPALFEAIEDQVDLILESAPKEGWEQLLKANETSLTLGQLESIEQKLFTRIGAVKDPAIPTPTELAERVKAANLVNAGMSLSLAWFWRSATARIAYLMAFMAVGSMWSYRAIEGDFSPLATIIYQAQGNLDPNEKALKVGHTLSTENTALLASGKGGTVTVVNGRGYVELRNGAALKLEKANRHEVRYRFAPSPKQLALGKATFFVNKRKGSERFEVATPDYRIDVVGTYFQVHPDLDGRVTTTVLEGKVHILSPELGDISLSQGQSLVFDEASGQYRVQDGGPIVAREAVENVPEMQELRDCEVLAIATSTTQAEITLDGRYRGVTPLAILQAPGSHSVRITKEGYVSLDTVITVVKGSNSSLIANLQLVEANHLAKVAMTPPSLKAELKGRPNSREVDASGATSTADLAFEGAIPALNGRAVHSPAPLDAETLFRQAEAAEATNWTLAVKLYEQVLTLVGSGMRREGALFAIARLHADHIKSENNRILAKQDFLGYLARYPEGAFTGESWLRLAEIELEQSPDKAVEYYLKVFERYPRYHRLAELQHRVGLIYLQQKRFDLAVDMFKQGLSNVLLDSESEKHKLLQSLQRALVAKGDVKGAARLERDLVPAP